MLEARAVARRVIVGGIHTARGPILARNIGEDECSVAISRDDAVRSLFNQAHYHVRVVDRHVFVVHLWLAAAQKIGQVYGQKANTRQARSELICQELGDVGFLRCP